VEDFLAAHGAHVVFGEGNHRNGRAFARDEFNLKRLAICVAMHNRADVAAPQGVRFQVTRKDHGIKFVNHPDTSPCSIKL
jgi:hypothetical protein